ncbi:MAG: methyltransferase domain-containing protein [Geminicoccaceae bacterium]
MGATLGQMLLGTEGLALLRLAGTEDVAGRAARVAEIRDLVTRYDAELAAPLGTPEYGLAEGYRLWSQTYDAPLRLFPVEEPAVRGLLAGLPPGRVLDAACGTGRHSLWLAGQGHAVVGVDASPDMLAKAAAKLPAGRFEQGSWPHCRSPTPRWTRRCARWRSCMFPACARLLPSSPESSGRAGAS